ncbi:unnamed protein product [Somion occarium]|uniref:Uncharacterized protein n=1 Tax=Somion occarium TaxID=3059160 RepID=A0ABP1E8Z8_9APHY
MAHVSKPQEALSCASLRCSLGLEEFLPTSCILPGGQPGAQPLEQFTNLEGNSFTWSTDQPAGTSIGLTIRDSTGATGSSAPFTINSGSDTSCLNASGSSSAGASSTSSSSDSASAGSSTSSSVSTPVSTPGSTVTTPVSTSAPLSTPVSTPVTTGSTSQSVSRSVTTSSSGTSSPAASPTGGANTSGAESLFASAGLAGVVGAFVAAIMA